MKDIILVTGIGVGLVCLWWVGHAVSRLSCRIGVCMWRSCTRAISVREGEPFYGAWVSVVNGASIRRGGARSMKVQGRGFRRKTADDSVLVMGEGRVWCRVVGRLCVARIDKDDEGRGVLRLAMVFGSRERMQRLLQVVEARTASCVDRLCVDWYDGNGYRGSTCMKHLDRGLLCDVDGLFQQVEDRVIKFTFGKDEYAEVGRSWGYTMLVHGPSGCGKTSMGYALASSIGRRVAVIKIGELVDNAAFASAISMVREGSVVLIEDIDKAHGDAESGVSMDRVMTSIERMMNENRGWLVIMTTSRAERIDRSLVRGGRVDLTVGIPEMTILSAMAYVDNAFPDIANRGSIVRELVQSGRASRSVLVSRLLQERWLQDEFDLVGRREAGASDPGDSVLGDSFFDMTTGGPSRNVLWAEDRARKHTRRLKD